jgi:hypothetical protein
MLVMRPVQVLRMSNVRVGDRSFGRRMDLSWWTFMRCGGAQDDVVWVAPDALLPTCEKSAQADCVPL